MKNRRFKYEYRENSSSLHKKVGNILRKSDIFKGFSIYQEYPVSRINSDYQSNREKFDWVVLELKIVIECHGRQHYEVIDFSGEAEDGGYGAFQAQKRRDRKKKNAALDAGFTYIEIPYYDEKKLDDKYIWSCFKANENTEKPIVEAKPQKPKNTVSFADQWKKYRESKFYREQLEKKKEIERSRYRKSKKKKRG